MSDTSTPKTDRLMCNVSADFARKLKFERDEAREKYTTLLTENMLEVHRLYKELDNAIAVADELAAIASLCLGWTLSNIKSSTDEANLAQADKITRALEHWKKLKNGNKQETNE